ncbi:MAG TPA: hypothetical protein ENJ52_13425 [Aliiroseovarius sp.]|nr:hypothetical protein [Aliiroseovarius sp.]
MTPEETAALFTGADGAYRFARWARPVVPVAFGVDDATLAVLHAAMHRATDMAGLAMAGTDSELGANLMLFFFRDWAELLDVPDLGEMLDDLPALVARLTAQGAQTYRRFRFDKSGAIRACFSFIRMSGPLADIPADALAAHEALAMLLTWAEVPPLERDGAGAIGPSPQIARLIRAAYDPALPDAAEDAAHALRLWARAEAGHGQTTEGS